MAIEFRCIRCGQKLRVNDSDGGHMARCPACRAVVEIPPKDAPDHNLVMAQAKSDVIDFELFGHESQYVEITLDPGEVTFARMEYLFYMGPGIAVEDAAESEEKQQWDHVQAMLQRMNPVGRRGRPESPLPITAFCNVGECREIVAFAPQPNSCLAALLMAEWDQQLICRGSSILCLARGIEIRDKDLSFLAENLILCELRGDGIVVLQASGQLCRRSLGAKDSVCVAISRLVAFTSEVRVAKLHYSGVESEVEIATFHGPGEIWLASGTVD